MNNLTLKQLRYFQALAREEHFGRAAEACAVSQPALSVQIKDLEDSLGVALFERSTRQVRLTGFGREFAAQVADILRSVDELGDLARASQGGLGGQLRLGVIPTIGPYLLPQVISFLNDTYPELTLKVRETLTQSLIQELHEGRLDAALVALPLSEPNIVEAPLFSEEFVLIRPPEEADLPIPAPDNLSELRLLLLEEGHCFRDQALEFCSFSAPSVRSLMDASNLSTLVQLVGSGVGITLVPEMAVEVETRSAEVAVGHFRNPAPKRTVGLIWREGSSLETHLRKLAGELQQVLRST